MYEIGKTYDVLALHLGATFPYGGDGGTLTMDGWHGFKGYLPLLHPFQCDEDFLNGQAIRYHAHVDWRFLPKRAFERLKLRICRSEAELLTYAITLPEEFVRAVPLEHRRMRCRRQLTLPDYDQAHWSGPLEAQYACAALKNGKCPHRGTPVEAMIEVAGSLVCPAHGLRWRDSKLQPRGVN